MEYVFSISHPSPLSSFLPPQSYTSPEKSTRLLTLSYQIGRYNYVLSGALDIGTAFCIVIVALALGLSGASFPDWWGNTVPFSNLDAEGTAVTKTLPDDGSFFGPTTWN